MEKHEEDSVFADKSQTETSRLILELYWAEMKVRGLLARQTTDSRTHEDERGLAAEEKRQRDGFESLKTSAEEQAG